MKKILCKILDFFCFISDNLAVIGGIALIAIMGITATDVVLRLFSKSIIGSMELIQYLMIVLVFLSFGKATFDDSFTKVEVFDFKKAEPIVKVIIHILHVALCLFTSYYCFAQTAASKALNTTSPMLKIVRWPFYIICGIGFLLIAVSIPLSIYREKKKAKNAESVEPGADPALSEQGEII